jgi:hypothetical protein
MGVHRLDVEAGAWIVSLRAGRRRGRCRYFWLLHDPSPVWLADEVPLIVNDFRAG